MSSALPSGPIARVETIRLRANRRNTWWLWMLSVTVLIPVLLPIIFLISQILYASESAWRTLFSANTLADVIRSLILTVAVTGSAVLVGVAAAWTTERTNIPLRRLWVIALSLPLVIPSYVLALSYLSFFGPRGLFADVTGLSMPQVTGAFGAWLALSISTYPYVFLISRASLRRIDPAFEEVAKGLGAGPWRRFRTVTLAQLRPAVGAGALLAALYTLSDFGAVSLMRFDAFTSVIYGQYQGRTDRTPAAVLSLALMVVALIVITAEHRVQGRAHFFSRRPHPRPPNIQLVPLTRRISLAGLGLVTVTGLVLPVVVLASWLSRGLAGKQKIDMRWGAVVGSFSSALLAALISLLAAIPIVILIVRHKGKATAWLRRTVLAIFSLPHITVAVAVVFFGARYLASAYQSFTLLVIIYATLSLAQTTSAGEAALLRINPNLEGAARSLGHSPLGTLRKVTLPLVSRGLLAGAALVFLTTMKELPATLLLRPTGFDTLAVRIWTTTSDLFYAQAAAPALLLLAVSAAPMYLLITRENR